jgi:hypothetical protein
MSWFVYAWISAVAAATTAILAKFASTLATAIPIVVTVFGGDGLGVDQQRAIPTIS